MANVNTITMRAAVTTQALGTMGVDPEWDRLMGKYLAAEALYFADNDFGPRYHASNEYQLLTMMFTGRHGPNWRADRQSRDRADAAHEEMSKVEEASDERFLYPFWQAARELVKYPAPTLPAALFKVNLIHAEEVWNDSRMDADCMQIVTEDMARLAA